VLGVDVDTVRLQVQRAAVGHGVAGVDGEVEDDLFELSGVGPHGGWFA
jgi:hypothetical protein